MLIKVVEGESCPGSGWYSLNCHWWDSSVVLGATKEKLVGDIDVWATGGDFAEAVANAIRYVEEKGHRVDQVTVNV